MATPKTTLQVWIDLAKWFITSVVLVVATMIIDAGFKDRQANLAELKFYDNYVTELIVLNPNPVQKCMLAQYFACVTPSEKLRERWIVYHDSIYPDYAAYIQPLRQEESLLMERCRELVISQDVTDSRQVEINEIEA
ncbi:MAG: hypothetical protein JXA23_03320, partial [Bacteroidales bacterium]|nr:hypothetical protein [Bacteroidales bacterium]